MVQISLTSLAFAACVLGSTVDAGSSAFGAFSGEASPVLLLQIQSQVKKDVQKSLPNVSSVLSKPMSIASDMESDVDALEEKLAAVQRKSAKSLAKQKEQYEKNLTAQHSELRAIRNLNTKLANEIASIDASNAKLRAQGKELVERSKALKSELQSLKGNISVAQEFLSSALNQSQELLGSAPQVLHDLAAKENEISTKAAHARFFENLATKKHLSAMQIGSVLHGHGKDIDAHGLLTIMAGAVSDLEEEQRASEEALRKRFVEEYLEGVEQREKLWAKQEELNSTKTAALDSGARLHATVSHLQETYAYLEKEVHALRSFARRLSSAGAPKEGMSLLQTSSPHQNSMPISATAYRTTSAYRDPYAAVDSMNSQVSKLQDHIAEMNQRSVEAASEQRMEYDRQLAEVRKNISTQRLLNEQIQAEIDQLDQSISVLRGKAEGALSNNAKMRNSLKSIQGNITIAQEFATQLLADTHEPLNHTKDLKILHELAELDASTNAQRARENELRRLASAALLQVVTKKPHGHSEFAHDVLSSIETSMKKLMAEQNATAEERRMAFEAEFRQEQDEYEKLLGEWHALNNTKIEKSELKRRLEVALGHVVETGNVLASKHDSLLSFFGQLAALRAVSATGAVSEVGAGASGHEQGRKSLFNVFKTFARK